MEKDERVFVYCKGADNIIEERIKNKHSKTYETVKKRIEEWSIDGLRTLLFAKR
jgi:magnesium-transporting ATPase (P-type)